MNRARIAMTPSTLLFCSIWVFSSAWAASAIEQQVQYFPHFADGGGYSTAWYFTGYGLGLSSIDIEFFDKNGFRQSLATDQGTGSVFHLSLNGYASASLGTLGGGGSVKTGWVRITSSTPVGATEVYRYSTSSGLISQAAVPPSNAVGSATLFVSDARKTAVALLNTYPSNTLNFRLLDKDGIRVGPTSTYSLQPGNQMAIYVNQIPGFEDISILDGSIELSGSSPFFLTSLVFEGPSFATVPILAGRTVPAGSRASLLNQFNLLVAQTKETGDQLLPPGAEDLALFADFLRQPRTGLIRLLPRETYDGFLTVRGGGAYYSFGRLTHEYGYGSDLELQQGHLSVGFAGADFGFLTSLGDVPIDSVTSDHPAVQYLASFVAPANLADARAQQQRAEAGFTIGAYSYIDRLKAFAASSYALRSINYNTSDVLVAFRVVRFDTDGSAILVWKLLRTYPVPRLE